MPINQPNQPVFRSAFQSPADGYNTALGVRPVVFDILAPDQETSLLPEDLKMVLHVNPSSMSLSYSKVIERIQTKGGYVEQHWGDAATTISFAMATGGFMRLYSGLSNVTGGGMDVGGTRRETIAYDKYLDMLALFKNNGSIYDTTGSIVFQGSIKITFDGGIYIGWFSAFNVTESADKPYQFDLTAEFTVAQEVLRLHTSAATPPQFTATRLPSAIEDAPAEGLPQRTASVALTEPRLLGVDPDRGVLTRGSSGFRLGTEG